MDPSICPVFWNDEKHQEFQLQMQRPKRVPPVEITTLIAKPDKLEEVLVKAGKVHWMEYRLEKGDVVSFRLQSNANFGFAIVFAENDEENDVYAMRQLFPFCPGLPGPLRVPIEGTVTAPETGLYKVWISNSRSWWTSLTVQYCFEVRRCGHLTK